MARAINDAGLAVIKRFEGCELTSYRDVAGIWTVGYGHIRSVTQGLHITQDEADRFLREDLSEAIIAVENATVEAATTDNQFGAMAALCFNIGTGNFRASTVLREHRAGNYAAAAAAFLMWEKAHIDGALRDVAGLAARRQAESALYATNDIVA